MRLLLTDLGLTEATAEIVIQSTFLSKYFDLLLALGIAKDKNQTILAVNYLLTDLAPLVLEARSESVVLTPEHFLTIIKALSSGTFTTRIAKDIIIALALSDADPLEYARANNLLVVVSNEMVDTLVKKVLAENQTVVAEYKAGKTTVLQYLLGQAMKQSRGTIAPNLIQEALLSALG
jgi:aspartyl-tRNA(Asn)/glutamyl-tRNA(Gln) amidotransferase subunit B